MITAKGQIDGEFYEVSWDGKFTCDDATIEQRLNMLKFVHYEQPEPSSDILDLSLLADAFVYMRYVLFDDEPYFVEGLPSMEEIIH